MSHVTQTYKWVMSRKRINESCHAYKWVMSRTRRCGSAASSCLIIIQMSNIKLSVSTHMNESSHTRCVYTYGWDMSHNTARLASASSCRVTETYEWGMSHMHIRTSHVSFLTSAYMNKSCQPLWHYTYECVVSTSLALHMWMSHVTLFASRRTNVSCQTLFGCTHMNGHVTLFHSLRLWHDSFMYVEAKSVTWLMHICGEVKNMTWPIHIYRDKKCDMTRVFVQNGAYV